MYVPLNYSNRNYNDISRQLSSSVSFWDKLTEEKYATYSNRDNLKSYTIERTGGNSKFFGFGIPHKLKLVLVDKDREIYPSIGDKIELQSGILTANGEKSAYCFAKFFIKDIKRDEKTNELTVEAYDVLEKATQHTFSELGLVAPYTIKDVASAILTFLDVFHESNYAGSGAVNTTFPQVGEGIDSAFLVEYPDGANLNGSETLREVLDAIAEATQTVYGELQSKFRFVVPGRDTNKTNLFTAPSELTPDNYMELSIKSTYTLAGITHTTELGETYSATTGSEGIVQYIRDNPFLNMREDIQDFLDSAIERVGGLSITEFDCEWRGNPFFMTADTLYITTKSGEVVESQLYNDTYEYNGGLKQKTSWSYDENAQAANKEPTTITETIKRTSAKVDKVNNQIELVASKTEGNTDRISSLEMNAEGITQSVSKIEDLEKSLNNTNEAIGTLQQSASLAITPEKVQIQINETLSSSGVGKVETSTGFTFDDTGLSVSKANSEMTTTITENGMKVYKDNEEMLVANSNGVNAANLHATTYLIVGKNSRFEDYGDRTGCFWIGG